MEAGTPTPQAASPRDAVSLRPLVIVGGGEHARVVADVAHATGSWTVIGYTHDADDPAGGWPAIPDLGTDVELAASLESTPEDDRPWLVLGFGGPAAARRRAVSAFGNAARWAAIVHPAAWVSPGARVGEGAVVMAGAMVNTGAEIGAHAILNTGVVVEHDVVIGSQAHLAPSVVVGGGTHIGEDAMIGLGAAIRDHLTVGSCVVVGMGAVVVASVPDDTLVLGVPARDRGPSRGA
jgi:acetyltransferase EpsM